jgi:hypothetical protein
VKKKKMVSSSSFTFSALFNLSLSIIAIVLITLLIDNNASNQLKSLLSISTQLETETNHISTDLLPQAQADQIAIENVTLDTCISERNSKCNNLTQNLINVQNQITSKTIQVLNQTLYNVIESCNSRMNLLREQIGLVNVTNPVPVLRSNGTFNVLGISSVYEIYTWTFEDFKMDYLLLKPWSVVSIVNATDTIITINGFAPVLNCLSSDGIRPVLKNLFWNFNVTEYEATCDSVKLYVSGEIINGQVLSQNKSFLIL